MRAPALILLIGLLVFAGGVAAYFTAAGAQPDSVAQAAVALEALRRKVRMIGYVMMVGGFGCVVVYRVWWSRGRRSERSAPSRQREDATAPRRRS